MRGVSGRDQPCRIRTRSSVTTHRRGRVASGPDSAGSGAGHRVSPAVAGRGGRAGRCPRARWAGTRPSTSWTTPKPRSPQTDGPSKNVGGHENLPSAAMRSPHWWPTSSPHRPLPDPAGRCWHPRRALSSQTPTSRCRSATAGRQVRARESPLGAGHAATGTRVALRSRPRLPARQHVRP